MRAVIRAVDFAVPARRMANEEFSAFLDTSDEWIRSHTGIGNRHVAEPSVATSDLAVEACQKVLEKAGVPAEEIDLVLVATATGDFLGFPRFPASSRTGSARRRPARWTSSRAARASSTRWRLPETSSAEAAHAMSSSRGPRSSAGSSTGRTGTPACFSATARAPSWCPRTPPKGTAESSNPCSIGRLGRPAAGENRRRNEISFHGRRQSTRPATFLKMDGRQVYNFAVKVVSRRYRGPDGEQPPLRRTTSPGSCPTRRISGSSRQRQNVRRFPCRSSS